MRKMNHRHSVGCESPPLQASSDDTAGHRTIHALFLGDRFADGDSSHLRAVANHQIEDELGVNLAWNPRIPEV